MTTRTPLEIAVETLERIHGMTFSASLNDIRNESFKALAAIRSAPAEPPQRLPGPLLDAIHATIAYLQLPSESAPGADLGMGNMLEDELERHQASAPVECCADPECLAAKQCKADVYAPVETLADDAGLLSELLFRCGSKIDPRLSAGEEMQLMLATIDAYRRQKREGGK